MLLILIVVNELFVSVIVFILVLLSLVIFLKNLFVFKCFGVFNLIIMVGCFWILDVNDCLILFWDGLKSVFFGIGIIFLLLIGLSVWIDFLINLMCFGVVL